MKWSKKGLIFAPNNNWDWMVSHASIPVVDVLDEERLRLYFGTRDTQGRSHTTYIDISSDDPSDVLHIHDQPILPLGRQGTFDDNGIMPSWLVSCEGRKYLYYIGWNPQVTVAYRLAIGLAISEDGATTFQKYSEGPVCDRGVDEPFFNTAPCIRVEGDTWRMWYVSCTGWEMIDGRAEPYYHVKYAESDDGFHWRKTGKVCIDYDDFTNAIGRPCVYFEDGLYKMFYSYRSLTRYRSDPTQSYRLGYAESPDGLDWVRMDDVVGIERSETGWDSEMLEYCYLHRNGSQTLLFYNGNGFGKTGVGYAVLEA